MLKQALKDNDLWYIVLYYVELMDIYCFYYIVFVFVVICFFT